MMMTPHAMLFGAVVAMGIGAAIVAMGMWWLVADYLVGSRQKRQGQRIKNARAVPCRVCDLRPVFLGRLRSFRGAQLSQVKVQKNDTVILVKRPLIIGKGYESPQEILERLSVGATLDLLEDDRGVVALRLA